PRSSSTSLRTASFPPARLAPRRREHEVGWAYEEGRWPARFGPHSLVFLSPLSLNSGGHRGGRAGLWPVGKGARRALPKAFGRMNPPLRDEDHWAIRPRGAPEAPKDAPSLPTRDRPLARAAGAGDRRGEG